MEHPFTQNMELNEQQAKAVSGGQQASGFQLTGKLLGPTPFVKPIIGTTMAIGEEGGSFNTW